VINFSQLNEVQILMFALILLRMLAFIMSAAIFSAPNISVTVKVSFSVLLTLVVFHSVATNEALVRLHEHEADLLLLSAREIVVGLALGFVTRLFFFAISMAGEIVSISMGLSQGQIFNPMMGSMGNAVEQFYVVIGTLIYLTLNGHHALLQGIIKSFSTVEIAYNSFQVQSLGEMVLKAQGFFTLGIKIAAPVMISMIVIQVGIALLSRAVPQINVLVTSASVTTLLGFIIIFISLPLLVMHMTGLMNISTVEFFKFLKVL
jgi:flagellar biosynthesis protein FliR